MLHPARLCVILVVVILSTLVLSFLILNVVMLNVLILVLLFEKLLLSANMTNVVAPSGFLNKILKVIFIFLKIGSEMVSNGIKKCQIISYMITLGLVTPIGIIIGIVLTSSSSSQTLVVGVMQVEIFETVTGLLVNGRLFDGHIFDFVRLCVLGFEIQ